MEGGSQTDSKSHGNLEPDGERVCNLGVHQVLDRIPEGCAQNLEDLLSKDPSRRAGHDQGDQGIHDSLAQLIQVLQEGHPSAQFLLLRVIRVTLFNRCSTVVNGRQSVAAL